MSNSERLPNGDLSQTNEKVKFHTSLIIPHYEDLHRQKSSSVLKHQEFAELEEPKHGENEEEPMKSQPEQAIKKKWRCPSWGDMQHSLTLSKETKRKCRIAVIILLVLGIVGTILGVYLSRKPEVVSVSEPLLTKYQNNWEEVQRYFFNISGLTYTGRENEGRGAASILQTSTTYSGALPQSTPTDYAGQHTSENNNDNSYRHYGFIDTFAQYQGVTVRGLNPQNRVYYVDYQTMFEFAAKNQVVTSRLLTAQNAPRTLAQTTKTTQEYFSEVLAREIATLEGVALDRINVSKEEVWIGTLNPETGTYTISTDAPQTNISDSSSQTEEQKKKAAQSLYDNVLKVAIEQKKNQLHDYGAIIADYFEFSFSRYVDLYITYEKTISFGSDEEAEEDAGTNSTNTTIRVRPKRPIVIKKVYEAVYGKQPERLKEAKTISRKTYEEMLACIDYNETTRACEVDEWLDVDSPNKISDISLANQANLGTRTRFRVSVNPLPPDQVVQEPYQTLDPEEMYKHEDSDDNVQVNDEYMNSVNGNSNGQPQNRQNSGN